MTLNRTNVKPNLYIYIDGVDVSEYVVLDGNFDVNTKQKVSTGKFNLDNNSIVTPKFLQEVTIFAEYDSQVKKFSGYITGTKNYKSEFFTEVQIANYSWKVYRDKFTGVFRNDAGKGNVKTVITDILADLFPDITWDNTSFPDVDASYNILSRLYNNQAAGDIFDELTALIERDWWIDKNKVFYCQVRTFAEVDEPVVYNTNTFGTPVIELNNKYANKVQVWGAKFEKTLQNIFSGTGAADEFDLDFYPAGSVDVEYSDGTRISTTFEGNDDYDNASEYDAYFKVSDQKLTFNAATAVGSGNIIVQTKVYDQIYSEDSDQAEVDLKGGVITVKEIYDENIATNEEALQIAQNYLELYGQDEYIFFTGVVISTQDQLENWTIGNSVSLDLGDGSSVENIVQEKWSWSVNRALQLELRFADVSLNDNDILRNLIAKIKREQSQIDKSSTNVTRFFYVGYNVVVGLQSLAVQMQATDGRFEMQATNQDARSWMSMTGTVPAELGGGPAAIMKFDTYTTPFSDYLVVNGNNKFVEYFDDDWFIDTDVSTGTLGTNTYEIGASGILQSGVIYYEPDKTVATGNNIITLTGTNTGSINASYTITDNKLKYTLVNAGVSTATLSKVAISYFPEDL